MGAAKGKRAIREQFLKDHPLCCFCGGATTATTEDHVPSRALFRDRQWPEGYVFPACQKCNGVSSKHELIIAMLGRTYPDVEDETHKEQVVKLMRSVHFYFPGL